MLTNRQVYQVYPNRYRAQMKLAKEIREQTRKKYNQDFRILNTLYGPIGTIILEFDYEEDTHKKPFPDVWYPMFEEQDWVTKWSEWVLSGQNELWQVDDPVKEQGTLAHPFTFRLVPGIHQQQKELAMELRELTQDRCNRSFRIINARYGPMQTIVLEFIHADEQAHADFSAVWYSMIAENGIQARWWQNVVEAKGELWFINE